MEFHLTKIIQQFLLPPGLMFMMMLAGLLLRRRYLRTGNSFFIGGLLLLWLVSTPLVCNTLVRWEENIPVLDFASTQAQHAQAIIVLGGGRNHNPPEYKGDALSEYSLVRAHYAAYIQRQNHLPILATGGIVYGGEESEAEILKRVIEQDYHGSVRWVEAQSSTTFENASNSYELLSQDNIKTIILVTHALHMRRSVQSFEQAGFNVVPAPTYFHARANPPWYLMLLPDSGSMTVIEQLMHEWLGRLWYALRY